MPEFPLETLLGPAPRGGGVLRAGRVICKNGQPWLFLPARPGAASVTASLYPAQSFRARFARGLLRILASTGVVPLGRQAVLDLDPANRFAAFLQKCAGTAGIPEFGILAGNSATPGARMIFLLFGTSGDPKAIVKAGGSPRARALVRHESRFLYSAGGQYQGVPRLRQHFDEELVQALALDYVPGDSPPAQRVEEPEFLLTTWVDLNQTKPLQELPAWGRLAAAAPDAAARLASIPVRPTLWHGDFAPWNIKARSLREWTVLDWERGELQGVPCWDWFHYVLQPAILVKRLPIDRLLELSRSLLASGAFKAYAARTGTAGRAEQLLKAYLAYCVEVIRPSEGMDLTREFLSALC